MSNPLLPLSLISFLYLSLFYFPALPLSFSLSLSLSPFLSLSVILCDVDDTRGDEVSHIQPQTSLHANELSDDKK